MTLNVSKVAFHKGSTVSATYLFGLIWLTFCNRALFQHFSVETQSITPGNSPYANYSHKKIITKCFFNSFNSGLRPFEKIDPNRT